MGNPELLRVSEPVESVSDPALGTLINDLWDTMAARGGSGIAAPQVGVSQRVVVFGMEFHPRYPDAPPVPRTVLINPVIEAIGDDIEEDWEGCLSVPGMRGWVPRHRKIRYQGQDAQGEPVEREAEGFHARLVQHECDHLDGVLYPQRIRDMTTFGFEEEISLSGRMPSPRC